MDNEEIARQLQANKDLALRNQARIVKLETEQKELRDLTTAVNGMVIEQKSMRTDLTEMKNDVKQIKEKPARRWDMMAEKILTLVIAAVVAWILTQIGL